MKLLKLLTRISFAFFTFLLGMIVTYGGCAIGKVSTSFITDPISSQSSATMKAHGTCESHYLLSLRSSDFDGEFEDLRYIEIPCLSESEKASDRMEGWMAINGLTVGFDSLLLKNDEISFRTNRVDGEYYIFSGTFGWKNRCSTDFFRSTVNGQLFKMRNDKFVAASNAAFELVHGCG